MVHYWDDVRLPFWNGPPRRREVRAFGRHLEKIAPARDLVSFWLTTQKPRATRRPPLMPPLCYDGMFRLSSRAGFFCF